MSPGNRVLLEHDGVQARFARRHLVTLEERAVYLTLVTERADPWSALEIAERYHLDPDEIERVLETFDAAGITETVDIPEARRHRWRLDMNYLFGEVGDTQGQIDPVCGMPVPGNGPYVAEDVHHRTRRFCSSLCLAAFLAFRVTFSGSAPPVVRTAG